MTQPDPAQAQPIVVAPPPSQDVTAQQVATILLAGWALEKTISALLAVFKRGTMSEQALRMALGLANHAVRARPVFTAYDISRRTADSEARTLVRRVADDDVYYRAAYLVKAAERMQADMDAGKPPRAAQQRESRFYDMHRRARDKRIAAAAEVARLSLIHGTLLGWYRNWMLDSDVDCIVADGCNFDALEGTNIGYPGSVHPNCFPAGTLVAGPAPDATFVRRYCGDMVEIRTKSGNVLAGTPNHPVLTAHGWVALGKLCSGDYVVRGARSEGLTSVAPHGDEQSSAIENCANAVGVSHGVLASTVEVAAEDFHGDGFVGEVDVVFADSALRRQVQLLDPSGKEQFVRADDPSVLLADLSSCLKFSERASDAPDGVVRRFGVGSFLRWCETVAPKLRSFLSSSKNDAVGRQHTSDGLSGDAFTTGEFGDALPPEVTLDQLVEVRRFPYKGHVYNLSTAVGWYLANGIVAHNCGCRAGVPHEDAEMVNDALASWGKPASAQTVRRVS